MDTWLQPVFTDLIENKKFSDCRISVGTEAFDCHKVILASASEFFERMFLADFTESKSGQFIVNDVKPETFGHFLQYVYTYNKEHLKKHSSTILMDLLEVGTKWLVDSIQFDCVMLLMKRAKEMMVGDLVELFQAAHNIDNKSLIDEVNKNLKQRFGPRMNCFDSLVLTSDVFEEYLILTDGLVEEIERFKMVEAYVSVNGIHDAGTSERSGDAEADKKEESDVGKIENEKLGSTKSLTGGEIKDGKPGSSKELCEVKHVDNTNANTLELHAGDRNEIKLASVHSKYVRTLLGHIKYEKMTKNQFYEVVGKSNLLDFKEKFENLFLTR
ncbi:kelch-like protein 40 [Drosophila obscura]|uniref:kelch-like protein 40 n=1 Tax=Drosophila obscura TaxID=7282 RepID=UPI001BB0EE37|nr:kelch-like protein 40 [Drosophila obscura]